ncbi:replicative DNA helicase [Hymenobacter gummosus]
MPAAPTGKLPPQALDLEAAVLGALMLEKDALTSVIDILKPKSFYKEAHQQIFQAILSLFDKTEPIDILTVTQELRAMGTLEMAGGPQYVAQLTYRIQSAANIETHARIITEHAIKRELIAIASNVHRDAYEDTMDVFNLLDQTEQALFEVSESNLRKNFDDMRSLMGKAIKELEEKSKQTGGLTGVTSGMVALDRVTSGWQKSDLVIIAARPAMGKCLGKGTKVLMYDGTLRNVEDVREGELLMGDDSTPRRVLGIARGRERMYWVRQNHAEDYRVNESHILSLKRSRNEGPHRHGEVLNITVREWLQKSDKFRSNYKGYKVPVEFTAQDVPLDPYFLGLWLGDGSSLNCRITSQDQEIVDYLHEYAAELDMQVTVGVVENRCNSYGITRGRQGGSLEQYSVQDELRQLGVLGDKHIPQVYLINSTENRLRLLAGLIDSDGHLNPASNGYEITQKNHRLARQIKFLADSLGFRTSIKKKRAVISSRGYESEVYRVRFNGGDLGHIPVRLARKKPLPWKSTHNWRMTGISVEFDQEDDYYGFEIDGNRLFLLQDMTVTHNTAFVLSCMRNAAVMDKKAVAFFSLEMSSIQLVNRLISAEAELDSEKIKKGNLADYEWQQLNHKIATLSNAPIFIDDTPGLSIRELRTKARRLKSHHDIQMIIIDYLQLMTGNGDGKPGGNREQEIASISRALKGIAKELNIPVIALSQLSRSVETRGGDKRPQLSDLRECVTGDTLVWLSDGRRVPIAGLVGQQPEVWALDGLRRPYAATADMVWPVGRKPVFRVRLASGRQITATAEHRLLGYHGWVTVVDLAAGSRLATVRTVPQPALTEALSEARIGLLAQLIGDGSYLSGQPLRFTTASEASSAFMTAAAQTEFGCVVNRHAGRGNWHQLVFSGNGTRWQPLGLNKWLRELGVFNQRSHEKRVPEVIFQLPNEQVALFLRHLWATDGSLWVPKMPGRSPRIFFATNSLGLAGDVVALLSRFGLVARRRVVQQGAHRPMYTVDVSGSEQQRRFLEQVGAFGDKQAAAEAVRAYLTGVAANPNVDTLPIEAFEEVRRVMRAQGVSQRQMAALRGTAYGGTAHFKFAPSREVLASYAECLHDEQLARMAQDELFWDTVVDVEPAGEEEVFDLTVPGPHNWLANEGIVSHNSGSIEQDADMVMFLYRPEYYGITEDEMGNPTQGVGEVIIAKHRNGGLDNIPLKFIGRFTKFADLDGAAGGFAPEASYNTGQLPASTFDEPDPGFAPNTIRLGSRMNDSGGAPQPFPKSNFANEDPPF